LIDGFLFSNVKTQILSQIAVLIEKHLSEEPLKGKQTSRHEARQPQTLAKRKPVSGGQCFAKIVQS
jgi:hypothetical protein